jgi:hypothetical protein
MAKENTEKNIWPTKRKWRMEDLHQSRVDGYVWRNICYLRNEKRKIMVVRTCGKNAGRKDCEESERKNIPQGKIALEIRERGAWTMLKMI